MTYTISKEFKFEASHRLDGLPPGHQCSRLHGHSYRVEVELQGEQLDDIGFVRDFGDLAIVKDTIDGMLDHRHLNDVMHRNPTAENLAHWFYVKHHDRLPEMTAVRVRETASSVAEYRP